MPYPKFEIEDLGVVHIGEIATTEVNNSSFEIPPDYFKACHNRHVDVGKVTYSVLILPKSLHFSHYIVSATVRTMHDVNTPCERPGMIEDEDQYQLEARFNRLYREDPFAELDDFIAELERQNGKPAAGGDPTTPSTQPPQPNPQPPAGGGNATPAPPPAGTPAPTPEPEPEETEEERRAREELERARERARELEEGNEQVFLDPGSGSMGGMVACRYRNTYHGIQVYVDDFTWLESTGRIIPYPSKDYFDVMKGDGQYYAVRYTYGFTKHPANIENTDLDLVGFKVAAVPVVIDDGVALMGPNSDQQVLHKVWDKAMIAQFALLPPATPIRLEKLSEAQKNALFNDPAAVGNLAPEFRRVFNTGESIAARFQKSANIGDDAARSIGLDLAVTLRNHANARIRSGINNCGC